MQQKKSIVLRLKKGKERSILHRHHWIYSGAILEYPDASIAEVFSFDGQKLGTAFLAPRGRSIAAHMIAFGEESIYDAIKNKIQLAIELRKALFNSTVTNAFRLINAEGDNLPGVIVDSYNSSLVMQVSHPVWEELKPFLIEQLILQVKPHAIFEKSTSFMRKKEGLEEIKTCHFGNGPSQVEVLEEGLKFQVDLLDGQKTGLFLDQREMRSLVRSMSFNKKVLNCFSYTGGFSVSALKGGAKWVDSIEISKKCEKDTIKNIEINDLDAEKHRFLCTDAIDFVVKEELAYDLVILDPPAFVKQREDIGKAFRAYKELNRQAIQKMPKGSFLLTSSCSYHVSEELFQNILFRASLEANRNVKIIQKHRGALDHPLSIYHPESSYLKSLLLWIE